MSSQGCLMGQFLNPAVNRREDEFGGSLENRMRFLVETLARTRRAIGSEKTLGARITLDEQTGAGVAKEETVKICQVLEQDGHLDYFSVISGSSASHDGWIHVFPPMAFPPAYVADDAAMLKAKVTKPVRDAGYLGHVSGKPPGHWDYHSYRNSEIKDFECSAKAIADRGYFVFRVGRFTNKVFRPGIPRVVDLSGDEELDDLIDIWLLAHCAFVVTTGTGIDTMALCLGRPMLFVNFLPIMHTWSWHYTMTFPKRLTWIDTGVELTFEEYVQNSWQQTQAYRDAGIRVDSLLPNEIRDAVIEFDDRLIEKWCETPKEAKLQTAAWECVLSNSDEVSHEIIHPKACFASAFLLSTGTKKNLGEGGRRRN